MQEAPIKTPVDVKTGLFPQVWIMWFQKVRDYLRAVYPTTQNDVTASRAVGTNYQNTTGKLMKVYFSGSLGAASLQFIAYTDSSATPTAVIRSVSISDPWYVDGFSFNVLPGNYYRIDKSAGVESVSSWVEEY